MGFKNKTLWITGAASGMGKATAMALAKYHCHLIISDRDEQGLAETAEGIKREGSTIRIAVLDMSDAESIQKMAHDIIAEEKVIHGLYQFAGISQRSLVLDTPLANDRKIMEINFFGVIHLAKVLLPHMIKNGGGQLAVASSLVGKFGFPYRSAYAASKHALHGYFESLLAENYDNNIRVSFIVGGRIKTNISKFALDKEGKEHGKMDPGQANGISPEKAAQQIIKGLKKDKYEIPVGAGELKMLKIKRFLPKLAFKLARTIKPN